ncbi:MAG: protease complex subunit PrcB family protein [Pseudomonadota bacterium]|nr:protease complex subunit PrcB family protein [Pseudomonadota bacterium]
MRSLIGVAVCFAALGAGCAVSQTETESGAPIARQIAQSAHCGLVAPGHIHLASATEVDRLESVPDRRLSLASLREVPFGTEHVVLVALGQKPTGGFSVTLAGAEIVDEELVLSVKVQEPEPGMMVTQALTTPCAAMAVTASGWADIRVEPVENNR